jgi:hypothetical protein
MRRLIAAAVIATTALLLTSCGQTYEEKTEACAEALKDPTIKGKPSACEGVTKDDYDTLRLAQALEDSGFVDDDGEIDMNKLLEDQ